MWGRGTNNKEAPYEERAALLVVTEEQVDLLHRQPLCLIHEAGKQGLPCACQVEPTSVICIALTDMRITGLDLFFLSSNNLNEDFGWKTPHKLSFKVVALSFIKMKIFEAFSRQNCTRCLTKNALITFKSTTALHNLFLLFLPHFSS